MKTALFFFSLLLLVTYYLLHVPSVSAQAHSASSGQAYQYNPNLAPNTNPDVPHNLHTWTQTVLLEVLSAATCQIAGVDPMSPNKKCLGIDQTTGKIGYVNTATAKGEVGGAIGLTTNFMTSLFTLPVSTNDYLSYLGQNFGIAKKAYAQSPGLDGLSPLIPLWIVFRNIVYLAFVVVFVVVGLAIMLRIKIDPRTVMSIENQIPKIIIGLILVTFSMAISGFLIDMMYATSYLTYNTIVSADPTKADKLKNLNPATLQGKYPIDAFGGFGIFGITGNVADATKDVFRNLLGIQSFNKALTFPPPIINPLPTISIVPPDFKWEPQLNPAFLDKLSPNYKSPLDYLIDVSSLIGSIILSGRIAGTDLAAIVPRLFIASLTFGAIEYALRDFFPFLIAYIIIFIALLWALIRLAFELLKAYIFILIDVTLAPFWIVLGLLPGSPISFGGWLRDIVANLSVFPVTIGMFLLGTAFMEAILSSTTTPAFVPPMVGNPGNVSVLASLIGLGIILITPQVVNMMKDALKAPQLKYTAAIGQAVGVGTRATNVLEHGKSIAMLGYYRSYAQHLPGIGGWFGKPKT